MMIGICGTAESFGERLFGNCQLGDQRRTRRLIHSVDRILAHPDKSLPNKFARPADYRAFLRLVNRPQISHQDILQEQAQVVLDWLRNHGPQTVVFPDDTTELDYSGQNLALGSIGNGGGTGFECHNTLAIDPDTREIFGLVNQILHQRRDVPPGERIQQSREDPNRESRLWVEAARAVGPAPPGKLWVRVCDRGADTFEYLDYLCSQGLSFVFRSCQSRALEIEEGDPLPHLLHDRLRTLPSQATWQTEVSAQQARDNEPAREARTATVLAAAIQVWIKAPTVHRGEHGTQPRQVWAIRVWEPNPPAGQKALEWLLLTDRDASKPEELRKVVGYYELRPVIEEYHKCQKTGVGIELLQLQSVKGLSVVIAVLSVVAVPLVNLRVAARVADQASRPAAELVCPLWVEVLSVCRYGAIRALTVLEFTLALARLGGHQNRKCDGLPGWLTLWRGWERLRTMVDYELARQTCGKH